MAATNRICPFYPRLRNFIFVAACPLDRLNARTKLRIENTWDWASSSTRSFCAVSEARYGPPSQTRSG
jgi:hypothetical protein